MKINAVAAAMSAALLAGNAQAEDVAKEASPALPKLPTFTVRKSPARRPWLLSRQLFVYSPIT